MPQKGPLRDAQAGVPPDVSAATCASASRVRCATAPRVNLVVGGKVVRLIEKPIAQSHVRSNRLIDYHDGNLRARLWN